MSPWQCRVCPSGARGHARALRHTGEVLHRLLLRLGQLVLRAARRRGVSALLPHAGVCATLRRCALAAAAPARAPFLRMTVAPEARTTRRPPAPATYSKRAPTARRRLRVRPPQTRTRGERSPHTQTRNSGRRSRVWRALTSSPDTKSTARAPSLRPACRRTRRGGAAAVPRRERRRLPPRRRSRRAGAVLHRLCAAVTAAGSRFRRRYTRRACRRRLRVRRS